MKFRFNFKVLQKLETKKPDHFGGLGDGEFLAELHTGVIANSPQLVQRPISQYPTIMTGLHKLDSNLEFFYDFDLCCVS